MNRTDQAQRIVDRLRSLGWSVDQRQAATGTIYLTCWHDDYGSLVARIADHDPCYPPHRPQRVLDLCLGGVSLKQALDLLERPLDIPVCSRQVDTATQVATARYRQEERQARERRQARAAVVRAQLTQDDWAAWKRLPNRHTARVVSARLKAAGLAGQLPAVYEALSGRPWGRR